MLAKKNARLQRSCHNKSFGNYLFILDTLFKFYVVTFNYLPTPKVTKRKKDHVTALWFTKCLVTFS